MRHVIAVLLAAAIGFIGFNTAAPRRVADGRAGLVEARAGAHRHAPPATKLGVGAPRGGRHGAPRPGRPVVPAAVPRPDGRGTAAGHPAHTALPPRPAGIWITVPRLGIHARVYEGGIHLGTLPIDKHWYSVTHDLYSGALGAAGNYVIYGHDDIDGNIFRYLGDLRPGDRVYFQRGRRRFVYAVIGSDVVWPTDVAVLDPTPAPTLTLITCTPFNVDSQRIVVTGAFLGSWVSR